nr:hypothetical protein [Tanacetum cinerariifolium]GEZ90547.1 hypothetical protein [Tanacetum cinerariifolium]
MDQQYPTVAKIPVLDTRKFEQWQFRIQQYLQHKHYALWEDINQIDEDDVEEMDIKWNMALLSMRADKAPKNQDKGRRDNYRQGSKTEEQAPKALMAIDGVGWDWRYMANDEEDHALVTDEVAPTEFALMANTNAESKALTCCRKPYRPSQRPVRTNMNGARPNKTPFNKQAHSYENRPFHRTSAVRPPYRAPWVPTVNRNFPPFNRKFSPGSRNFPTANRKFSTASRKFPTGSTKCSTADIGMKGKVIKPSACWFWKPS